VRPEPVAGWVGFVCYFALFLGCPCRELESRPDRWAFCSATEGARVSLQAEVDGPPLSVERITAVARRSPCFGFADLMWSPTPDMQTLTNTLMDDPGVLFETDQRVVVFQRIGGELRYYAGGWCLSRDRIVAEQHRISAEGCELGVFGSVADALAFAEGYLVAEQSFAALRVPRDVRYGHQPGTGKVEAELRHPPDPVA
jgi:hypothetical protein